ncbi:EamA family transporter [Streptomyces sp. NPDC088354]|uniref:EamA family transporter n=1 Tax=unclassified Streptomyces TaxID=2593676 RepID=UPI0029BB7398|nr:EamA family transporter [Streptomyces sp. MI02-7b]MDX3073854.1 EamA family transporter [Streptomyces sp. MI02-7b]
MPDLSPAAPSTPERPLAARAPAGRARFLHGALPVLTAALLWGTTGTAASFAPAGAAPASVGGAGLVLGGLLLLAGARGVPALLRSTGHGRPPLLAVGALAVAGYPLAFYPAVSRTGVAVATVIALGSAPVLTGLLAWAARLHRPGPRWTAATATAVLGCALLVLGGGGGAHTRIDGAGVALAAVAGLSYAVYSLVGAHLIGAGHAPGAVMGVLFGAAGTLTLPAVLASGATTWLPTPRGAAVVLHLALLTTFLAYRLFGHGLRSTTASAATTLTLAEPAVAAVLGVAVLGERLGALSWTGLAVLGLALAALTREDG